MNKELSPKQKEILNTTGKFVVNACAGSGKTFTLSKKLAKLIKTNNDPHMGIATLSFTNTAWKEIKQNLDEMNVEIRFPHFIGTFDKFINKFIFYKYYYLLPIFKKRPILVGDVGTSWNKLKPNMGYGQYFDIFSLNSKGNIIKTTQKRTYFKFDEKKPDKHHDNIKKMKCQYFKEGFVTQDDINFFSYKLINQFDFISEIIANRFPIFLIDEAQDTNKIKMDIIDKIITNPNVQESIFIGDFNQAIYEWNGADPKSFKELTKKYKTINLDENWRSSKKICEFTSRLVTQKYKAVNPNIKSYTFTPEVNGYAKPRNEHEFFNNIINEFLELCEKNDIIMNKQNVAVLCKGNALIKTIQGKSELEEDFFHEHDTLYDLIYSKWLFDSNRLHESYKKVENLIISLILKEKRITYSQKKEYIDEFGFFEMRQLCFNLIDIMPPIKNITLNEWVIKFKTKLKKSDLIIKQILLRKIKPINKYILISDLFENAETNQKYSLSTIHKVKGESFDAILLILRTRPNNESGYKKIVKKFKKNGILTEELRNIYVAITRPRKILVIYVPKSHEEMWYELFFNKPFIPKNQLTLSDF